MSHFRVILMALSGWFRNLWTKPTPSSDSCGTTAASSSNGPSAQSEPSSLNEDSVQQPAIVSPDSEAPELSTEAPIPKGEVHVSITLASIGAAISAAVVAAEGVTAEVAKVYTYATTAMADAETAYAASNAKGGTKLASVLAATAVVATDVGADWPTIQADVTALITNVKAAYNNAIAASTASTTTTTTTS